jgi:hypothetical protein
MESVFNFFGAKFFRFLHLQKYVKTYTVRADTNQDTSEKRNPDTKQTVPDPQNCLKSRRKKDNIFRAKTNGQPSKYH